MMRSLVLQIRLLIPNINSGFRRLLHPRNIFIDGNFFKEYLPLLVILTLIACRSYVTLTLYYIEPMTQCWKNLLRSLYYINEKFVFIILILIYNLQDFHGSTWFSRISFKRRKCSWGNQWWGSFWSCTSSKSYSSAVPSQTTNWTIEFWSNSWS